MSPTRRAVGPDPRLPRRNNNNPHSRPHTNKQKQLPLYPILFLTLCYRSLSFLSDLLFLPHPTRPTTSYYYPFPRGCSPLFL